jgi:hypothetical protein
MAAARMMALNEHAIGININERVYPAQWQQIGLVTSAYSAALRVLMPSIHQSEPGIHCSLFGPRPSASWTLGCR